MPRPLVAITTDLIDRNERPTAICTTAYAHRVHQAGGLPVLLPPIPELADIAPDRFDAFVLTGGDDPVTEPFGVPTHPRAAPLRPERQALEVNLLRALKSRHPDKPVLGVCLGMQLMALIEDATLDQYMPESTPNAERHWDADHHIHPTGAGVWLAPGIVHSRHKQAITQPGALTIAATSDDHVIEALDDPARRFYKGVQWHPERTAEPALGANLFTQLIAHCHD
ncbi:MAG: gamma-glutamyl-gamma-aminobutyrate hydrolase family protein [Phycisphaerales bacterium JB059]